MYGLTAEDQRIRDTAREFVESLIPYEVEAELAGGQLPKELTAEYHARAIELGLYATNMPDSVGGPGCTALQQVLVQEQVGRVTNGLAWVTHTPPQWWADVATDYQRERWLLPAVRGEKHEAYAITEEFAGSDVSDLRDHRAPGRRRVRRQRHQVARHVVQPRRLLLRAGRARRTARTPAITCCWWSTCRGPASRWCAHRTTRTTSPTSTRSCRSPTCGYRSRIWSAPRAQGMTFTQDWFRFERLMVAAALCRCRPAPRRRDDRVRQDPHRRRQAARRLPAGRRDAGRQRDRTVRRPHHALRGGPVASTPARTARPCTARRRWPSCYCSEMAGRVADRAVQVFGGRGYMRENVAERMFRELRVERIWEGASEIQRDHRGAAADEPRFAGAAGDAGLTG